MFLALALFRGCAFLFLALTLFCGEAFLFLAFWYALAATAFWLVGFETQGRSIEEIDESLVGKARAV